MKGKIIGILVVLGILAWVGYVAYAALNLQPELSANWGTVNEDKTEIIIKGTLNRPLLVPAEVESLTIEFMNVPVARIEEFNYSATGTEIGVLLGVDNHRLVRALVDYMNAGQHGEVKVAFKGKLLGVIPIHFDVERRISENLLEELNFTAESQDVAGGLIKTPALVETRFDWAGEENGKGILVAHMKLYNPNAFAIPIGNVSFDVYANGVKAGYGGAEHGVVIPPKGYSTLDLKTYIDENSLPKVWALHVKNGERSVARADIFLTLKLINNEYRIKLGSYEQNVTTDIMGEINDALNSIG